MKFDLIQKGGNELLDSTAYKKVHIRYGLGMFVKPLILHFKSFELSIVMVFFSDGQRLEKNIQAEKQSLIS